MQVASTHIMLSIAFTSAVSAFNGAPVVRAPARASALTMGVESMEGVGPETGGKVWDPLGLATMASEPTLAWYRHAELKHGRVAMAAWVGFAWMYNAGWTKGSLGLFPGDISMDGTKFADLGTEPFAAWDAVPVYGKVQILLVMGMMEWASETDKPHYMNGGTPGKITVFGIGEGGSGRQPLAPGTILLKNKPASVVAASRVSEIKNGRLAMIGVMSVFAEHFIPGSVPLLKNMV